MSCSLKCAPSLIPMGMAFMKQAGVGQKVMSPPQHPDSRWVWIKPIKVTAAPPTPTFPTAVKPRPPWNVTLLWTPDGDVTVSWPAHSYLGLDYEVQHRESNDDEDAWQASEFMGGRAGPSVTSDPTCDLLPPHTAFSNPNNRCMAFDPTHDI